MSRRVLVVCTANVCRSPMAAGSLAHHLREIGADVTVTSAGTRRYSLPVDPYAVDATAPWGVDISTHQPRMLDRTIVREDGRDLIITMTREQLREVASMDRTAWKRTFTLKELVRRASATTPGLSWDAWLEELGNGRRAADLLGDDPADDVSDPYGLGARAVATTAAEIHDLMRSVALLAPWQDASDGLHETSSSAWPL